MKKKKEPSAPQLPLPADDSARKAMFYEPPPDEPIVMRRIWPGGEDGENG